MSKRTSTGLAVLLAIAAICVLVIWKWPRRDAPQTPEALARLAVEALRWGDLSPFRAAIPEEGDLHWAGQQLGSGYMPTGSREVWDWVASHGSPMPVAAQPFPSDKAVFEVLRRVAPAGLVGGDATFVGLDSEVDPSLLESGLVALDIRFRVACEGDEHRFVAQDCFACPRGWVCLSGLRYEGPVAAPPAVSIAAPHSLLLRFSLELDAGMHEALRPLTIQLLRERLRRSKFRGAYIVAGDAETFEVVAPGSYLALQHELVALMTRSGSFMLRIEVLPEAEYLKRAAGAGVTPMRPTLWKGTAAEFEAFKAAEIELWRKARDTGVKYAQSRVEFRLVKAAGTDGSDPEHFHLILVQTKASETLNGGAFEPPVVSVDALGKPVLVFRVRPAWESRLWRWTGTNQGMPLAIVVEGEWLMAPLLVAPLRDSVQVTLGVGATRAEAQQKAEALAPVLGGPGLPSVPKFQGATRK